MHPAAVLLGVQALAATAAARAKPSCPTIFDGRVGANLALADFDSGATSPFNPEYVKGAGLTWSEILAFPADVPGSRFDVGEAGTGTGTGAYKAVEVTIGDDSIFQNQRGFRRAGLQFAGDANEGGGAGGTGAETAHFSVRTDAARGFNLSHEYLLVWHEAADYSADQVMFEAGTLLGREGLLPADSFKVLGRQGALVWSTPMLAGVWQNFAIGMDFGANTVQVYYSEGDEPLEAVTAAVANDLSGEGQYQVGILKKPTGTSDVVNSGYQESGLDEGLIYGGLFVEDSTGGCVSL